MSSMAAFAHHNNDCLGGGAENSEMRLARAQRFSSDIISFHVMLFPEKIMLLSVNSGRLLFQS
ncbi:hypothetical protein BDW75DRAFT_207870 [Aspergillus navahoensis]